MGMEPWYQVVYYNLSDKSELFLSSLNQLDKMIGGIKDRKFLEGDESPGIADFNIWPWIEMIKYTHSGCIPRAILAYSTIMEADPIVQKVICPPEIFQKFSKSHNF